MQKITSAAGLKDAIELLEAEHKAKGQLLKEQLFISYESLKPVNVLRRTLKEIASPSFLIDDFPGALMAMASGYISRKAVTGRSGNIFRKLLGSLLQFGVTSIVAKNSDTIKSTGLAIFQHFLQKKITKSKSSAI